MCLCQSEDATKSRPVVLGVVSSEPPIQTPPAYSPRGPETSGSPVKSGCYHETSSSQVVAAPEASKRSGLETSTNEPAKASSSNSFCMKTSTQEDPYAFLSSFDTIFVIDDSGSMSGRSWDEVRAVIKAITPICTAHDADGIDLYFLNHKKSAGARSGDGKAGGGYYGITDVDTVENIFNNARPREGTPTGQRLQSILKPYLQLLDRWEDNIENVKPINIIVITDGAPSDDVEAPIVSAAKKLDKIEAPMHQVGIQFFQVGNEPGASEALRDLDDELVNRAKIRDMVDTVTWENGSTCVLTADSILKVVLGAVVRRLDRRWTRGEGRR